MKLRFYARADELVGHPEQLAYGFRTGAPKRYIGRTHVVGEYQESPEFKVIRPASYPAVEAPEEFDTKHLHAAGVQFLQRKTQKGGLWPADAETAAFCGVPLVPVKFVDGEWIEAPASKPVLVAKKTA